MAVAEAATDKDKGGGAPQVRVKYLNTNESAKVEATWTDTLNEVWTKAYEALDEQRKDVDQFETDKGDPLASFLDHTLEQVRDQKISVNLHFAIRSETGGA